MADIKLGEYTLVYDFNALCEAEDILGPIGAAMSSMSDLDKISFKTIRGLVWAGLLAKHPGITIEQAGLAVQKAGIVPAATAVGEAMQEAFGEASDDGGKNQAG